MTDEERKKLCEDLRRCKSSWLEEAANEIEELEVKIKHLEAEVEDERQSHKATLRDSREAANEIERLAIQNRRLKRVVRVREQRRQNDVGVAE